MKQTRTAAMILGAILTASAMAFAAQTPAPAPQAKSTAKKAASAPAAPATHATSGVIKSMTDTNLVISKSATKGPETTFVLNSTTQKEGNLAVGSMVDVRFHQDGKDKVASAISLHEAKSAKAKK